MNSTKDASNNQPSDSWYRRLVESTDAIPWELDVASFRFTHIGEKIVPLLGYSVEQWYSESFWEEHVHPDDKEKTLQFCISAT